MAERQGPCFVRFGREAVPVVTDESTPFEIGKARLCREGSDVTVFANGAMVFEAQNAADALAKEGISVRVYDLHTVKPLDEETVLKAAEETGCVVTAEEHQVNGGMGSAVAECLAKHCPVPMEFVGMQDSFGESGDPQELMDKYGLNQKTVEEKIRKVLSRRR